MTTTMAKAPAIGRETRKFTVDEYFRMVDAGILKPKERVELIEGEILVMPPMGTPHFGGIMRYTRLFASLVVAARAALLIQAPLPLDENSAPEPDVALLKYRDDDYTGGFPSPEDVLLVIEVADSSLNYDRDVKAHIYGRACIPETSSCSIPAGSSGSSGCKAEPGSESYGEHADLHGGRGWIAPVIAARRGIGGGGLADAGAVADACGSGLAHESSLGGRNFRCWPVQARRRRLGGRKHSR